MINFRYLYIKGCFRYLYIKGCPDNAFADGFTAIKYVHIIIIIIIYSSSF